MGLQQHSIKTLLRRAGLIFSCCLVLSMGVVSQPTRRTSAQEFAQGECSTGYFPNTTGLVQNGNFASLPTETFGSGGGHPGNDIGVPAYFYSGANFYSQLAYVGNDVYPDQGGNARNAASIQNGDFGNPFGDVLYQVEFPGDPAFNVPGSSTWLYTNGNVFNGGEYLTWSQQVSGLTVGKEYVFVTYISNVIEPPANASADPKIIFRIGGDIDRPNGDALTGVTVLDENQTSNGNGILRGWQRVAIKFIPDSTTEILKITDSSDNIYGDDFAMTSVMLQECVPINISCDAVSATPNYPIYNGQPVDVGVRFVQDGSGSPPDASKFSITMSRAYEPAALPPQQSSHPVTLISSGGKHSLSYAATLPAPNPLLIGKTTVTFSLVLQTGTGPQTMGSCSAVFVSHRRPYFEVRQNDVWTGANLSYVGLGAEPNAQIRAFARRLENGTWRGSGTAFAAIATGKVEGISGQDVSNNFGNTLGFISAIRGGGPFSPAAALYSNTSTADSLGGDFDSGVGIVHQVPNYYFEGRLPLVEDRGSVITPGMIDNDPNGRQYQTQGYTKITGGVYNRRATIFVNGDVFIEGNMQYGSYIINGTSTYKDVPYMTIVALGNIYINSSVTNIDAFLVAQQVGYDKPETGRIITCAKESGGVAVVMPPNEIASSCASQLRIRGALLARTVQFLRSAGDAGRGVADPNQPAELIESGGALYAGKPVFRPTIGGDAGGNFYSSITGLPPVFR